VLDFLSIYGRIELIDFEAIEVSNLNRYFIATTDDVGHSKVTLAQEFLSHNRDLVVSGFNGKYEEFVRKNGRGKADIVLPLVDNNEARHQVQMNMPALSIYGTTGGWVLSVARQKALEDDCIIVATPKKS
jgi:molybdopterin/thiamine biosynthesis adenylyltransferase